MLFASLQGIVQVLRYLEQFDKAFKISEVTRYNTAVNSLFPISEEDHQIGLSQSQKGNVPRWKVQSTDLVRLVALAAQI